MRGLSGVFDPAPFDGGERALVARVEGLGAAAVKPDQEEGGGLCFHLVLRDGVGLAVEFHAVEAVVVDVGVAVGHVGLL